MTQRWDRKGRKNIGYSDSSTFLHSSKRIQRQPLFASYGRCTDSTAEKIASCSVGIEMN